MLRLDRSRRSGFHDRRAAVLAEFAVNIEKGVAEPALDPASRSRTPSWFFWRARRYFFNRGNLSVKAIVRAAIANVRAAVKTETRPLGEL